MWYIYTLECYSAIKKNEIMLFSGKWMKMENVMQSEVRLKRIKVICFPSYVEDRPIRSIYVYLHEYIHDLRYM
jgi:hypothetical protein